MVTWRRLRIEVRDLFAIKPPDLVEHLGFQPSRGRLPSRKLRQARQIPQAGDRTKQHGRQHADRQRISTAPAQRAAGIADRPGQDRLTPERTRRISRQPASRAASGNRRAGDSADRLQANDFQVARQVGLNGSRRTQDRLRALAIAAGDGCRCTRPFAAGAFHTARLPGCRYSLLRECPPGATLPAACLGYVGRRSQ